MIENSKESIGSIRMVVINLSFSYQEYCLAGAVAFAFWELNFFDTHAMWSFGSQQ